MNRQSNRTIVSFCAAAALVAVAFAFRLAPSDSKDAAALRAKANASARTLSQFYPVNAEALAAAGQGRPASIAAGPDGSSFEPAFDFSAAAIPDGEIRNLKPVEQAAMKALAERQAADLAAHAVHPVFPGEFSTAVRLNAHGASVSAVPHGANKSSGALAADGSLVYTDAFDGCDVSYRCTALKTEEFIIVKQPRDSHTWSWDLNLQSPGGELSARLTPGGSVEFVDAQGFAQLRIDAAEGKDASGTLLRAGERLKVALEKGALGRTRLTLSADLRGLTFPVAIDPSFSATVDMNVARAGHTATLLKNGKVLVAGGANSLGALTSCELFDPNGNGGAGTWTVTASMFTGRQNHTATLLKNGKVLVAGGADANGNSLNSAELYDPAANGGLGAWLVTGSMTDARQLHRESLLADGRVFVTGGQGLGVPALNSTEIFDPAGNGGVGAWIFTSRMALKRVFHTATALLNGKVLVCGGQDGAGVNNANAELFDPTAAGGAGAFAPTGLMSTGRDHHVAALLLNGDVLIAGGFNQGLFPSAETYSLTDGTFDPTGSMTRVRTEHRGAVLTNGKVLLAGCHDGSFANVELYDPILHTFAITASMVRPHTRHTVTTLANGKVLITGGFVSSFFAFSELYDPHADPIPQAVVANGTTPLSIVLTANSIDNNPSTFSVVTQPAHGVVSGTVPNLVYTAFPGYSGPDSFTFNATDFFGPSKTATISITVNSLIPIISGSRPDAAIVGSPGFTITINGTNFVTGSAVLVNGQPRSTTFVNATQLTAPFVANDISSVGLVNVTVVNPTPGGGTSAPFAFSVQSGMLGTWIVTTTADSGLGSLRSAMNNIRPGESIIFDPVVFDLANSSAATVINALSPLPPLDKGNATIDASNRRVTINGSGAGSSCGLTITSNGNTIRGLTILGFTKSGICINSANNNLIGGSRILPATGTGPNGQGLRISNCGTFGIEIDNGSCNNVVKGCWIGLDASGSAPEPNLAGILIQSGSCTNQIGSTLPDEANVVSGNRFEGITVSDPGTNNNVILGNVVGASANAPVSRDEASSRDDGLALFTRGGVGNGNAGIFLSKGTNGTQVGGDNANQSNAIGFNGGNGVEVRAPKSKKNTSKRNKISKNRMGGITLFDGSNNNIQAPTINSVLVTSAGPRDFGGPGAGFSRATISGSSSIDGTVEVFTDPDGQGGTFVGRTTTTNGQFSTDVTVSQTEIITATITDAAGNTSPFSVFGRAPGVTPPAITSPLQFNGAVGAQLSYPVAVTGTPAIAITTSTLPDGLVLSNGVITGVPTKAGTYLIMLSATNPAGTDTKTLVLVIGPAGTVPAIGTDGNFNTMDSDGDGVPDVLEILAGSDPSNSADFPAMQGTVTADKATFNLLFVTSTKLRDNMDATVHLTLPDGFSIDGSTVGVQLGGAGFPGISLNAKGKGTKGTATATLKAAASAATIRFSVKGEDLKARLAQSGMINTTTATAGLSLKVPIAVAIGSKGKKYVYTGSVQVLYKAKQDKIGKAKK